ncbi:hypothetical protein BMETH_1258_0 [methanotrophic bacterial endosymbiont of Bathymodiolus sp.]|nr:hypothetical protein BMETH_1258_0 [methanotrophic bacterial endosymbiont of Bathymodiolus sp.]
MDKKTSWVGYLLRVALVPLLSKERLGEVLLKKYSSIYYFQRGSERLSL